MAGIDVPRRRTPDDAAAAAACRDFCLQVLELLGGRVQAVPHPAGESFHIALPESLAWRWGNRGRPRPALWLAFDTERQGSSSPARGDAMQAGSRAAEAADANGAEGPELVLPSSRRFWEIQQLSLEFGWLVVLHQPGRRHFPALWLWMEVLADGGPLARAPVAGQAVVWTPLAGSSREPAIWRLSGEAAQALPVLWGPPAGLHRRRRGSSRRSLLHALESATLALASSLICRNEFRAWLTGLAEEFSHAGPRIRLFLNLAALIYLDEDAPWPPPPLLRLTAPSP